MVNSLNDLENEEEELNYLKRRFYNWKRMFQNVSIKELSEEREQGLFGELYFLYKYMIPNYGIDKSIISWAGPLKYNKDFSIDNTWYELKTSSVSATNIKITSLSQLDSDEDGFLGVAKVEKMSYEYKGKISSVLELIELIMKEIDTIQIQDNFLDKLVEYGIGPENNFGSRKFEVKKCLIYKVDEEFPKLTRENIKFVEIENVSYTISLSGIEKFKVEEL